LSHVFEEFQCNLQLPALSPFITDYNCEKLSPELALFVWGKVSVHGYLLGAIRAAT
jgi:hypothetical protein